MSDSQIVLFDEGETIRRVWDEETEQWYFAVVDIVKALADSKDPSKYWYAMKRREKSVELSTLCRKFRMKAANNRTYQTECASVENTLRIIQSIPSPKAEPFKQWLAKVGRERLEEIESPELAAQRARELYKAKGYSDEWIEARLQSIAIRNELTDEWKERGVQEGREYAILTAEISRATFGITPGQHKEYKGLKRQNLRDHMTNLELVFTMLGEASTTEITRKENAQGFDDSKDAAKAGGKIAGDARQALEGQTGRPVLSSQNYLEQPEAESLTSGDDDDDDDVPF